jgi:hypothetical protein
VGHEFKHVEEVLDTAKTLAERYSSHDPNVRKVGNGTYESEAALETESEIRSELAGRTPLSLPPGAVEFNPEFDLFSVGSFVIEGIFVQLAPQ